MTNYWTDLSIQYAEQKSYLVVEKVGLTILSQKVTVASYKLKLFVVSILHPLKLQVG